MDIIKGDDSHIEDNEFEFLMSEEETKQTITSVNHSGAIRES